MRIDLYNSAASQIANDLSSQQVGTQAGSRAAASSGGTSGGVSGGDRTSLTSGATAVASLVGAALSSPEVRQGKVDSLRQAISSGQYQIDPASIAAAMAGEPQ